MRFHLFDQRIVVCGRGHHLLECCGCQLHFLQEVLVGWSGKYVVADALLLVRPRLVGYARQPGNIADDHSSGPGA